MKKVFLSIALSVGMLGSAMPVTSMASVAETCGHIKTISENVMVMRQLGTSQHIVESLLLEQAQGAELRNVARAIISEAYAEPQVYGEARQEQVSQRFAREKYHQCMSVMSN